MQNDGIRHLVFYKNGGIGHAFYFKAIFHTDEILNESRCHLEFWSNDVLHHMMYFLVLYRTFAALFQRNTSILGEVITFFSKSKKAAAI